MQQDFFIFRRGINCTILLTKVPRRSDRVRETIIADCLSKAELMPERKLESARIPASL